MLDDVSPDLNVKETYAGRVSAGVGVNVMVGVFYKKTIKLLHIYPSVFITAHFGTVP